MYHMRSSSYHAAGSGKSVPGSKTVPAVNACSRPRFHRARAEAAFPETSALVDLIQWPEGTRPKRGGVTKAALARLKVAELRAELARFGADSSGTKEQLAEKLLQVISEQATATPTLHGAPVAAEAAEQPQKPQATAAAPPQAAAAKHAAERSSKQPASSREDEDQQDRAAAQQPLEQQPQQRQQQKQMMQQLVQRGRGSSSSNSDERVAAKHLFGKHGEVVQPGHMPKLDLDEARRVAAQVGVQLEDLPPLVERSKGQVYDAAKLPGLTEEERELVLKAVRSGLALSVLGGSMGDAAGGECAPPCVALLRDKDTWLFDVGEDVQRSLLSREHLRPSKMHRIVITRQAPDAMLGLPGVLCVIGASREKGHEVADTPVHVYGPAGTAEFLSTLYECSNTFLEMPVVVHEFVLHAVPEEEMQPQPLNMRAKLWRALMPPDQLNPLGFIDGDLQSFMPTQGRARVRKGIRAAGGVLAKNPRAGHRPMRTPPPGDPSRTDVHPSEMTWTVVADEAAMMTAVLLDAEAPSWGLVWQEASRQGNLNMERCKALGITDAEVYGRLKNGEAVPNVDGVLIPAPMCCSQDKPGRKVVLLPACRDASNLGQYAAGADVMIAAAEAAAEAAGPGNSGQVGLGLGMCAQQWGVRNLVVTGMPGDSSSSSSGGDGSPSVCSAFDEQEQQQQQEGQQHVVQSDEPEDTDGRQHRWLRSHPAAATVISVVSEQFTHGEAIPARDMMSLIVEENLGHSQPPPVDYEAKAAEARATCLSREAVPDRVNPKAAERRQRRELDSPYKLQKMERWQQERQQQGQQSWRSASGQRQQQPRQPQRQFAGQRQQQQQQQQWRQQPAAAGRGVER